MKTLLLTLPPIAALLLAGCGADAPAADVERIDSAGVEVVVNRAADRSIDWRFEPVLTLGGEEEGPEAFYRIGAGSIAADAAGNLHVLDRGNHRVVVFDPAGRHVRTVGRKGGGPGELQWPQHLVVSRDGTLAIADIGHRGLVRLTATGEPLEHRRIDGWRGGGLAPFGEGIVVEVVGGDGETRAERLTYLGPQESRELLTVPGAPTRPIDLGCVRISGMPPLFAPSLVWAAGEDRIAAVAGAAYEIDLYDATGLTARIRRDRPERPATRALAVQEVGEKFEVTFGGGGSCVAEPEKVVDQRGFADVVPAIRSLAVAPDGALWVRRFAVKGDPAPVDVFAPDGSYLGTLPDDAPFPAAFLPDGRIVAVEKDELDVERVAVYRVEGGGSGSLPR